jgi:replicative DNA helicase Mcm
MQTVCSVLAAANPIKGRFNKYDSISKQINLEQPILTRFDLIFAIQDIPEIKQDENISAHIIKSHYAGELMNSKKRDNRSNVTKEELDEAVKLVTPELSVEFLQKYVAYARLHIHPIMTTEAMNKIHGHYLLMRATGQAEKEEDERITSTPRQLEALIRLSESSAKMRLSKKVEASDADDAIRIMMKSIRNVGTDPLTGKLDIDRLEIGEGADQRARKNMIINSIKTFGKGNPEGWADMGMVAADLECKKIPKKVFEKELRLLAEIAQVEINGSMIRYDGN